MRTQNWKRHITGLLAALLAVSMPVQALGAAVPGSRAHVRSQAIYDAMYGLYSLPDEREAA